MVKYFHYYNTNPGQERHLDRLLESERCIHMMTANRRCRKRCLMGLQMCWIHLQSVNNVRIRDAGNMGKGLFASDGTQGNEILFRRGEYIITYEGGESMTEAEIDDRYGDNSTGPYAVRNELNEFEDCAIWRCAASFINSNVGTGQITNCRLEDDEDHNVIVTATRSIRNGDQLFCSYGPGYRFHENGVRTATDGRTTLY